MARILDAASKETQQSYVEVVVQVMCASEERKMKLAEQFQKERGRVTKGSKEAKWNQKYMKVIEKPVS